VQTSEANSSLRSQVDHKFIVAQTLYTLPKNTLYNVVLFIFVLKPVDVYLSVLSNSC
jgi:hypothetical protein